MTKSYDPEAYPCKRVLNSKSMIQYATIKIGDAWKSVGAYETQENANAAIHLMEQAVKLSKSEKELQARLVEIKALADIDRGRTYCDVPRRKIKHTGYEVSTGKYKAIISRGNVRYNLGYYTPYELDVCQKRIRYVRENMDTWSNQQLSFVASIFQKIQRNERISEESLKNRLLESVLRAIGVCMTEADGAKLTALSDKIDTILLSDFNRLTRQDIKDYQIIILYDIDKYDYPIESVWDLPNITCELIENRKLVSVTSETRKDGANGT